MKRSLLSALSLFSFPEIIRIISTHLSNKYHFISFQKSAHLFSEYLLFVDLIDKHIKFRNYSSGLIQANILINKRPYKIILRKNTSDIKVFQMVLVDEEYKLSKDHLLKKSKKAPVIIDAGSNIGLTSIYYFAFMPDAKIISIEPNLSNFAIQEINIKINGLKNTVLLNKALWFREENLFISKKFRDNQHWSSQVMSSEHMDSFRSESVTTITLNDIAEQFRLTHIDLLKMDIEGSEKYLYEDQKFVELINSHVSAVVIEIHDEYKIRHHIDSVMNKFGFISSSSNDLTFYQRTPS
ncbi:MAG: hypothetical protein RLZ10_2524 [Bacteroidota bacterium]